MIQHLNATPVRPARVIVLGGSGFLGRHLLAHLRSLKIDTLRLSSTDLNLEEADAGNKLASLLRPSDALVFASCLTPDKGKDIRTAMRNLAMGEQVCIALQEAACAHVVYISSDAVYPDAVSVVRESTPAEPSSLYGLGHLMRERMVCQTAAARSVPCAVLRLTLVYGHDDSHNSYGPNRFARQARQEGEIKLFGNGEEKRDHIHVDDAAALVGLCLRHRSAGVLNLATGVSSSFGEVARLCAEACPTPVAIKSLPRTGPITHRHYDTSALIRAFPAFACRPLREGVVQEYFRAHGVAA
jgi:nucleoside-diphosphate-sugar epimerase